MSETTTQEAPQTEAAAAPAAEAPKAKAPAQPKLVMKWGDKELPVAKYGFPVKPNIFKLKVNGAEVQAATTAGRGKAYTYLMINNTSFYVPGVLPPDAEVSITFPDNYKFDDKITARTSNYKPKKAKKVEATAAADGSAAPADASPSSSEPAAAPAPAAEPAPNAPKATRRGK